MEEIQTVQRRDPSVECGMLIGVMVIKLPKEAAFTPVQFNCTKPKFHRDECVFEGVDLSVQRRRRD